MNLQLRFTRNVKTVSCFLVDGQMKYNLFRLLPAINMFSFVSLEPCSVHVTAKNSLKMEHKK